MCGLESLETDYHHVLIDSAAGIYSGLSWRKEAADLAVLRSRLLETTLRKPGIRAGN